jgi:hypothetical protein
MTRLANLRYVFFLLWFTEVGHSSIFQMGLAVRTEVAVYRVQAEVLDTSAAHLNLHNKEVRHFISPPVLCFIKETTDATTPRNPPVERSLFFGYPPFWRSRGPCVR